MDCCCWYRLGLIAFLRVSLWFVINVVASHSCLLSCFISNYLCQRISHLLLCRSVNKITQSCGPTVMKLGPLGGQKIQWPGTNRLDLGTDLDLDLEPWSIFPLFNHGDRAFSDNDIKQDYSKSVKLADECSCTVLEGYALRQTTTVLKFSIRSESKKWGVQDNNFGTPSLSWNGWSYTLQIS